MNKKTIVFDLDDTISFCHDRDWENAKPNIELIRKINKLYNDGWYIHIHSGRGQLSGTDYTEIVSKWLEQNGVLFHKLEFGKPLATLYVDDKGISVEDFMNIEIAELPGGWSGSTVTKVGNKVFKTDNNIFNTVKWYEFAEKFYNVPKILGVVGSELALEFIKSNPKKERANFEDLFYISETFSVHPPLNTYKWKHYIDRVASHCDWLRDNKNIDLHKILPLLANMKPPQNTFSHGDLTPDNSIVNRKGYVVLIDPLNITYSSYELDQAKLKSWALRTDNNFDIVVNNLVVSETIRTLKYAPDDVYLKLVNRCLNFLNQ